MCEEYRLKRLKEAGKVWFEKFVPSYTVEETKHQTLAVNQDCLFCRRDLAAVEEPHVSYDIFRFCSWFCQQVFLADILSLSSQDRFFPWKLLADGTQQDLLDIIPSLPSGKVLKITKTLSPASFREGRLIFNIQLSFFHIPQVICRPFMRTCDTSPATEDISPVTCCPKTLTSVSQPVSSSQEQVSPRLSPDGSILSPVVPKMRRVTPVEKPVSSSQEDVAPKMRHVTSVETPVAPRLIPVSSSQEHVALVEKPVSSSQEHVTPKMTSDGSNRRLSPVALVSQPVSSFQEQVSPRLSPVSSSQEDVAPKMKPVSPRLSPVSSSQEHVAPKMKPVSPRLSPETSNQRLSSATQDRNGGTGVENKIKRRDVYNTNLCCPVSVYEMSVTTRLNCCVSYLRHVFETNNQKRAKVFSLTEAGDRSFVSPNKSPLRGSGNKEQPPEECVWKGGFCFFCSELRRPEQGHDKKILLPGSDTKILSPHNTQPSTFTCLLCDKTQDMETRYTYRSLGISVGDFCSKFCKETFLYQISSFLPTLQSYCVNIPSLLLLSPSLVSHLKRNCSDGYNFKVLFNMDLRRKEVVVHYRKDSTRDRSCKS